MPSVPTTSRKPRRRRGSLPGVTTDQNLDPNAWLIDEARRQYLANPASVSAEWRAYFEQGDPIGMLSEFIRIGKFDPMGIRRQVSCSTARPPGKTASGHGCQRNC